METSFPKSPHSVNDKTPDSRVPQDLSDGAYPMRAPEGFIGLSIRDYFAAAAMQSILASAEFIEAASKGHPNMGARDAVAVSAYDSADAMLKARAPKPAPKPPVDVDRAAAVRADADDLEPFDPR